MDEVALGSHLIRSWYGGGTQCNCVVMVVNLYRVIGLVVIIRNFFVYRKILWFGPTGENKNKFS